jgi:hypothetical protein
LFQLVAYSTVVARPPVMIAPVLIAIPWAAIIAALIGFTIIGSITIVAINALSSYNESKKLKTSTTTNPMDVNVPAGQSMTTNKDASARDLGGGNTIITDLNGESLTLGPGQIATVPSGGTVVGGKSGAVVTLPGGTEYTETEPEEKEGVIESTVKWIAIGGITIALSLLGIAAMQSFGKRELYHMK